MLKQERNFFLHMCYIGISSKLKFSPWEKATLANKKACESNKIHNLFPQVYATVNSYWGEGTLP